MKQTSPKRSAFSLQGTASSEWRLVGILQERQFNEEVGAILCPQTFLSAKFGFLDLEEGGRKKGGFEDFSTEFPKFPHT